MPNIEKKKCNSCESFKKYTVQADSIEDFIERYGKPKQYRERGPEYMEACIASHKEHLAKFGFDFITHHDSKTGEIVSYYPNKQNIKKEKSNG